MKTEVGSRKENANYKWQNTMRKELMTEDRRPKAKKMDFSCRAANYLWKLRTL